MLSNSHVAIEVDRTDLLISGANRKKYWSGFPFHFSKIVHHTRWFRRFCEPTLMIRFRFLLGIVFKSITSANSAFGIILLFIWIRVLIYNFALTSEAFSCSKRLYLIKADSYQTSVKKRGEIFPPSTFSCT